MRLEKLRSKFESLNVDGILITNSYNRKYISGFTGSTGVCLISKNEAKFITDFRYIEQATEQCKGFEVVNHGDLTCYEMVNKLAVQVGIKRLAFEEENLTVAAFSKYQENAKHEFVPVSNVVEELRMVKTKDEIATLQIAAEIADATFAHILQFIRPGVTEIEIANEMEFFMRKSGATCSSFDIIVASGWRSALPHGIASDKVVQKGEMITLDFGAIYNHYVSDMTRTIALGDPGDKMREVYDVVLQAQLSAGENIRAGITGKEADSIARDHIVSKGYGEFFGHGLGHGIGLEVHEGPRLSKISEVTLEAGNIVTNEPGIYLPGVGGVRIEDDLVVTEKGNYSLTISPKTLIII